MSTKQQVSPIAVAASVVALLVVIGLVWFLGFNRKPVTDAGATLNPNQPPAMDGKPTPSQLGEGGSQAPSPMGAPQR
jgi:hypothetical protein